MKRKLKLSKDTIAKLTDKEISYIKGGGMNTLYPECPGIPTNVAYGCPADEKELKTDDGGGGGTKGLPTGGCSEVSQATCQP